MAANLQQPPVIIDLEDELTIEGQVPVWDLDGFGTLPKPAPPAHKTPSPNPYSKCLQQILKIFPDISHEHVQKLWDKRGLLDAQTPSQLDLTHQFLIEQILDGGVYPKERDRLKELKKRKRDSPEAEAARWKFADLRHDPEEYARIAKTHLSERFDWVPSKFIINAFKEHTHYYGAFFAIDEADRKAQGSASPPFVRLKSNRVTQGVGSAQLMVSLEASGHDFTRLKEEIEAAKQRWNKEEAKRRHEKETLLEKEAKEEEYRRKGDTMECACCFDDVPPPSLTHCKADEPHFFCFDCARRNAINDMTSLKYALRCMDQSRCDATFGREQRQRFLDAATIDKLERLQQQDEIRRADMGDLESCPFCDYAAICPPVDANKVFECANPECLELSCRLCKEKNHVPMSCEEFKKENGIEERHAIEEARTMALIRSCKKCKVQILKEDGCNKVVCTNCYSVICDFCGEDITKVKYQHFDGDGRVGFPSDKGKCPLYDTSNKRKEDQIEQAGKAAMEKVQRENPDISEDDLKIKFAKAVEETTRRRETTFEEAMGANMPHGLNAHPQPQLNPRNLHVQRLHVAHQLPQDNLEQRRGVELARLQQQRRRRQQVQDAMEAHHRSEELLEAVAAHRRQAMEDNQQRRHQEMVRQLGIERHPVPDEERALSPGAPVNGHAPRGHAHLPAPHYKDLQALRPRGAMFPPHPPNLWQPFDNLPHYQPYNLPQLPAQPFMPGAVNIGPPQQLGGVPMPRPGPEIGNPFANSMHAEPHRAGTMQHNGIEIPDRRPWYPPASEPASAHLAIPDSHNLLRQGGNPTRLAPQMPFPDIGGAGHRGPMYHHRAERNPTPNDRSNMIDGGNHGSVFIDPPPLGNGNLGNGNLGNGNLGNGNLGNGNLGNGNLGNGAWPYEAGNAPEAAINVDVPAPPIQRGYGLPEMVPLAMQIADWEDFFANAADDEGDPDDDWGY